MALETRRSGPRQVRLGLLALLTLPLLAGCQTNQDPRSGGFVEGVVNLSTGGYDAYTEERRQELETKQEEARTLEARAAAIEAEKDALDKELASAAKELEGLQKILDRLRLELDSAETARSEERARLAEAQARAQQAGKRLTELREDGDYAVESRQTEVKDLKKLIGSVALMVSELSN